MNNQSNNCVSHVIVSAIFFATLLLATVQGQVVINEIMYHPVDAAADVGEYVELVNWGDSAVELSGWSLADGIDFVFPTGTFLNGKSYLVIAKDPAFLTASYGLNSDIVLGPFNRQLANGGERIVLLNASQVEIDSVTYDDSNGWPQEADGDGSSLELKNPIADNNVSESWASSECFLFPCGTPGNQNSTYLPNPPPIISETIHSPAVPKAGETVLVTSKVEGVFPIQTVTLFYLEADDITVISTPMTDDGSGADVVAGDSTFSAEIIAPSDGVVTEFYIHAQDGQGTTSFYPSTAPVENALFVTDNSNIESKIPTHYRIIIKPSDWETLYLRDPFDDTLLNTTFIGDDGEVIYHAGIRFRGATSRTLAERKSYRVDFRRTSPFGEIERLNLNANYFERQFFSMNLMAAANVPAPDVKLIYARVNADDLGPFTQIERLDSDFLTAHFGPDFDDGNLYEGVERCADLWYRGENKEDYRNCYDKVNNVEEDDFSDLIALTKAMSDPDFYNIPNTIAGVMNVDEWIDYFAVNALIATFEGSISNFSADDYYLYNHPGEGRFLILPWDLDETLVYPIMFVYSSAFPAIRQTIYHPDLVRHYQERIKNYQGNIFSWESIEPQMEAFRDIISDLELKEWKKIALDRHRILNETLPSDLSSQLIFPVKEPAIQSFALTTAAFGSPTPPGLESDPLKWTTLDYDDSTTGWVEIVGAFGYLKQGVFAFLTFEDYKSLLLRYRFDAEEAAPDNLRLRLRYSADFIAYLNGKEILRQGFNQFMAPIPPPVPLDEPATQAFEMDHAVTFDLSAYAHLIKEGDNILAFQVHNTSPTLEAFVFEPILAWGPLVSSDVVVSDGASTSVEIGGLSAIPQTYSVSVNGRSAVYDVDSLYTGEWRYETMLQRGRNNFKVTATSHDDTGVGKFRIKTNERGCVYETDSLTDSLTLHSYAPTERIILSGTISSNRELTPVEGFYILDGDVNIGPGATLTIEPGTVVLFKQDARLLAVGNVIAEGTSENPILFAAADPYVQGAGVTLEGVGAPFSTFSFVHVQFRDFGSLAGGSILTVKNTHPVFKYCHFSDSAAGGIYIEGENALATIEHCSFENIATAISLAPNSGQCTIRECQIKNIHTGDGIRYEWNGSGLPTTIENCQIDNVPRYGLYSQYGLASSLRISRCGQAGIFTEPAESQTTNFYKVAIFDCAKGLEVAMGSAAIFDQGTIADNLVALAGHLSLTAIENSIIWGNDEIIAPGATGSPQINYTLIQNGATFPGTGDFTADPKFIAPVCGDFHIPADSPARGKSFTGDDVGAYPFTPDSHGISIH